MSEPRVKVVPKEEKPQKGGNKKILSLLLTLLFGAIYYYFSLPAINLKNPQFYGFFMILAVGYCVIYLLLTRVIKADMDYMQIWKTLKKECLVPMIATAALVLLFGLGWLFSSVVFRAKAYADLLPVTPGDFAEEVEEISFDQIPRLDRDSAVRLGDRKLGELADLVSQFEVSTDYPQMNYNGTPVRVATLRYGDFFKWWNNFREGLPGYVVTDLVTQNVELVRLDSSIRYSQSDKFFRNISRYLRVNYPTYMFDSPHMEIDDAGDAYWICPRLDKTIGLFGGTDVVGVVIVNAVSGEMSYYDVGSVPVWVDQVYSDTLIVQQYDFYGKYGNGFLNSIFGQKDVSVTTEGSNFIAQNDDVYTYTGITSAGDDQSIIGFIMTNQRTKQTSYYACAGAKEYSAMSSAQGVVQHLAYESTFPLLLNISTEPTYFMSLKDNAGLVKMYAMVNVQQYNIVATGSTVAECRSEYIRLLGQHGISEEVAAGTDEVSGAVEDIRTAVIEGNSYYYFKLTGDRVYYAVSAAENDRAVIISVGDRITMEIDAAQTENGICPANLK